MKLRSRRHAAVASSLKTTTQKCATHDLTSEQSACPQSGCWEDASIMNVDASLVPVGEVDHCGGAKQFVWPPGMMSLGGSRRSSAAQRPTRRLGRRQHWRACTAPLALGCVVFLFNCRPCSALACAFTAGTLPLAGCDASVRLSACLQGERQRSRSPAGRDRR